MCADCHDQADGDQRRDQRQVRVCVCVADNISHFSLLVDNDRPQFDCGNDQHNQQPEGELDQASDNKTFAAIHGSLLVDNPGGDGDLVQPVADNHDYNDVNDVGENLGDPKSVFVHGDLLVRQLDMQVGWVL